MVLKLIPSPSRHTSIYWLNWAGRHFLFSLRYLTHFLLLLNVRVLTVGPICLSSRFECGNFFLSFVLRWKPPKNCVQSHTRNRERTTVHRIKHFRLFIYIYLRNANHTTCAKPKPTNGPEGHSTMQWNRNSNEREQKCKIKTVDCWLSAPNNSVKWIWFAFFKYLLFWNFFFHFSFFSPLLLNPSIWSRCDRFVLQNQNCTHRMGKKICVNSAGLCFRPFNNNNIHILLVLHS